MSYTNFFKPSVAERLHDRFRGKTITALEKGQFPTGFSIDEPLSRGTTTKKNDKPCTHAARTYQTGSHLVCAGCNRRVRTPHFNEGCCGAEIGVPSIAFYCLGNIFKAAEATTGGLRRIDIVSHLTIDHILGEWPFLNASWTHSPPKICGPGVGVWVVPVSQEIDGDHFYASRTHCSMQFFADAEWKICRNKPIPTPIAMDFQFNWRGKPKVTRFQILPKTYHGKNYTSFTIEHTFDKIRWKHNPEVTTDHRLALREEEFEMGVSACHSTPPEEWIQRSALKPVTKCGPVHYISNDAGLRHNVFGYRTNSEMKTFQGLASDTSIFPKGTYAGRVITNVGLRHTTEGIVGGTCYLHLFKRERQRRVLEETVDVLRQKGIPSSTLRTQLRKHGLKICRFNSRCRQLPETTFGVQVMGRRAHIDPSQCHFATYPSDTDLEEVNLLDVVDYVGSTVGWAEEVDAQEKVTEKPKEEDTAKIPAQPVTTSDQNTSGPSVQIPERQQPSLRKRKQTKNQPSLGNARIHLISDAGVIKKHNLENSSPAKYQSRPSDGGCIVPQTSCVNQNTAVLFSSGKGKNKHLKRVVVDGHIHGEEKGRVYFLTNSQSICAEPTFVEVDKDSITREVISPARDGWCGYTVAAMANGLIQKNQGESILFHDEAFGRVLDAIIAEDYFDASQVDAIMDHFNNMEDLPFDLWLEDDIVSKLSGLLVVNGDQTKLIPAGMDNVLVYKSNHWHLNQHCFVLDVAPNAAADGFEHMAHVLQPSLSVKRNYIPAIQDQADCSEDRCCAPACHYSGEPLCTAHLISRGGNPKTATRMTPKKQGFFRRFARDVADVGVDCLTPASAEDFFIMIILTVCAVLLSYSSFLSFIFLLSLTVAAFFYKQRPAGYILPGAITICALFQHIYLALKAKPNCLTWSPDCERYYGPQDQKEHPSFSLVFGILGTFMKLTAGPDRQMTTMLMAVSAVGDLIIVLCICLMYKVCRRCLNTCHRVKHKGMNGSFGQAVTGPSTIQYAPETITTFGDIFKKSECTWADLAFGVPVCYAGKQDQFVYVNQPSNKNFEDWTEKDKTSDDLVFAMPNTQLAYCHYVRYLMKCGTAKITLPSSTRSTLPKNQVYPQSWENFKLPSFMPNRPFRSRGINLKVDPLTFAALEASNFPGLEQVECVPDTADYFPSTVGATDIVLDPNGIPFIQGAHKLYSLTGEQIVKLQEAGYNFGVDLRQRAMQYTLLALQFLLFLVDRLRQRPQCGRGTEDPFCRNPFATPKYHLPLIPVNSKCDGSVCSTEEGLYRRAVVTGIDFLNLRTGIAIMVVFSIIITKAYKRSSTSYYALSCLSLLVVQGVLTPEQGFFWFFFGAAADVITMRPAAQDCILSASLYFLLLPAPASFAAATPYLILLIIILNPFAAIHHGFDGAIVKSGLLSKDPRCPVYVTPTTLSEISAANGVTLTTAITKSAADPEDSLSNCAFRCMMDGKARIFIPKVRNMVRFLQESKARSQTKTQSTVMLTSGISVGSGALFTASGSQIRHLFGKLGFQVPGFVTTASDMYILLLTASHNLQGSIRVTLSEGSSFKIMENQFFKKNDLAVSILEPEHSNIVTFNIPRLTQTVDYTGPAFWSTRTGVEPGFTARSKEGNLFFCFTDPGDSGSAVIDSSGGLIGIHSGSNQRGRCVVTDLCGRMAPLNDIYLSEVAPHFRGPLVPVPELPPGLVKDVNLIPSLLATMLTENNVRPEASGDPFFLLCASILSMFYSSNGFGCLPLAILCCLLTFLPRKGGRIFIECIYCIMSLLDPRVVPVVTACKLASSCLSCSKSVMLAQTCLAAASTFIEMACDTAVTGYIIPSSLLQSEFGPLAITTYLLILAILAMLANETPFDLISGSTELSAKAALCRILRRENHPVEEHVVGGGLDQVVSDPAPKPTKVVVTQEASTEVVAKAFTENELDVLKKISGLKIFTSAMNMQKAFAQKLAADLRRKAVEIAAVTTLNLKNGFNHLSLAKFFSSTDVSTGETAVLITDDSHEKGDVVPIGSATFLINAKYNLLGCLAYNATCIAQESDIVNGCTYLGRHLFKVGKYIHRMVEEGPHCKFVVNGKEYGFARPVSETDSKLLVSTATQMLEGVKKKVSSMKVEKNAPEAVEAVTAAIIEHYQESDTPKKRPAELPMTVWGYPGYEEAAKLSKEQRFALAKKLMDMEDEDESLN